MSTFRGRKVIPLVAAGLSVGGTTFLPGIGAEAASVAAAPLEVWTTPATPLPFSGPDPVSGASRSLAIEFGGDDTTCVVNTPGTNDFVGDCAGARLAVPVGAGTITVDDAQLAYVGAGRSGESDFTITGPIATVQAALASVTYTPPAAFTTDGGAPVPFTVEGYDAGGGGLDTRTVAIHVTAATGAVDSWFTHLSRHVYTPRGVQLDFTAAPDPVTGEARHIAIDPPFDSSGCTFDAMTGDTTGTCLIAVVEIAPTGTSDRGSLLVGADTTGVAFTPLAFAGAFSMAGTEEQVQAVLSSLSYLPPDDTFTTTPENPVPIHILLFEADGYSAPVDVDAVDPTMRHDEYVYVHVGDLPEPCVEVPETTEPPVETTEPEVPETTEPEVPETTEPDVPETTEPEVPETTEPDDPDDIVLPTLPTIPIPTVPTPTITIPSVPTVPLPTISIPVVTPPPFEVLTLDDQQLGRGAFGYARPLAAQPDECPPATTTPGGNVPSGSLPATGSPALVIAAIAGVLTASGAALLAARGPSKR